MKQFSLSLLFAFCSCIYLAQSIGPVIFPGTCPGQCNVQRGDGVCINAGGSHFCECGGYGLDDTFGGTWSTSPCPKGWYSTTGDGYAFSRFCDSHGVWRDYYFDDCSPCPAGQTSPLGSDSISDCYEINGCDSNSCSVGATCSGSGKSITCTCPARYVYPATVAGKTVVAYNCPVGTYGTTSMECLVSPNGLWNNEVENCSPCPLGYNNPNTGLATVEECFLADPCASNPCSGQIHTYCQANDGLPGYQCLCLSGYVFDSFGCIPTERTTYLHFYDPIARFLLDKTFLDSSENGHTCTSDSSTFYEEFYMKNTANNHALQLSNQRIITSPIGPIGSYFSMEIRFNLITLTPAATILEIKGSNNNDSVLRINANRSRFILRTQNGNYRTRSVIKQGVTYSYAISVREGKIVSFLDDVQLGIFPLTIPSGTYTFFVGGGQFVGYVDEIGIYRYGLYRPTDNIFDDLTRCTTDCGPGFYCENTEQDEYCRPF